MGCGCKNKGNASPQPVQQVSAAPSNNKAQSVQEAIKKTVEKYYTSNKGTGK